MKHLVSVIVLFSSILFINIAPMFLGSDAEGSSLYKIYCILIFIAALISHCVSYSNGRIRSYHFASLAFIAIYIFIGLFTGYTSDVSMLCLVAYSLPAMLVAIYYSEHHNISSIIKWIDVILPPLCLSMAFSLLSMLRGIATSEGSSYSQGLSYHASYCFLLYLLLLVFGKDYERFSFFQSKGYRVFSILMLPYLLIIMLFSGGRGAIGTFFVGVVYILYLGKKRRKIRLRSLFKYFVIGGVVLTIALQMFSVDVSEVFTRNLHRAFSFFDSSQDLSQRTSGRDVATEIALDQIVDNPLGTGLFSYKDSYFEKTELTYPHNLFLEFMMQGGFALLYVFFILGLAVFSKAKRLMRDEDQAIVILFGIFSLTKLMFSDSYMQNAFFWFFVTYMINYRGVFRRVAKKRLACAQ